MSRKEIITLFFNKNEILIFQNVKYTQYNHKKTDLENNIFIWKIIL